MYWRAIHLGDTGRQDKEVEGYDELIARFGESDNEDIIELFSMASIERCGSIGIRKISRW